MVVYQLLLQLAINVTFYHDGSWFSNAQVSFRMAKWGLVYSPCIVYLSYSKGLSKSVLTAALCIATYSHWPKCSAMINHARLMVRNLCNATVLNRSHCIAATELSLHMPTQLSMFYAMIYTLQS